MAYIDKKAPEFSLRIMLNPYKACLHTFVKFNFACTYLIQFSINTYILLEYGALEIMLGVLRRIVTYSTNLYDRTCFGETRLNVRTYVRTFRFFGLPVPYVSDCYAANKKRFITQHVNYRLRTYGTSIMFSRVPEYQRTVQWYSD